MFKLLCLFIGLSVFSSVGFSMTGEKCLESTERAKEVCGSSDEMDVAEPSGGDSTSRQGFGNTLGSFKTQVRKTASACKAARKVAKKDTQDAKQNGEPDPSKIKQCEENLKEADNKQEGLDKMGDDVAKKEKGNEQGTKDSQGDGKMPDLSSLMDALKKKDEPKPPETAPPLAAADPNNCSNPAAAGNKVCICQANPRNPGCDGAQASTADDSGVRTRSPSAATGGGLGSDFKNKASSAFENPQAPRAGSSGLPPGGSSGSGGVGSGQGSQSAAAAKYDPYQSPFKAESGSGGGGGGGGPTSGSSSIKGLDTRNIAPVGGKTASYTVKGGRKPASLGGVGTDGITGPHTNLFNKIRNRYYYLRTSLKQ